LKLTVKCQQDSPQQLNHSDIFVNIYRNNVVTKELKPSSHNMLVEVYSSL